MAFGGIDYDDPDVQDAIAEDNHNCRMMARFRSGLNCDDPDHGGCPDCEPETYGDWEDWQ